MLKYLLKVGDRLPKKVAIAALAGILLSFFPTISSHAISPGSALIYTQPAGARTGVAFTQQPVIHIRNSSGVLDTSFTGDVIATIATGTGTLSGTTTVAAVAGVATFTNLAITGTAGAFALTFTPTSRSEATSNPFDLLPCYTVNGSGVLTSGSTCSGSVTIDNAVTSIGATAFVSNTAITSVTMGSSVTSIGAGAFEDNTALTSVTIGSSVTSIGSSAFRKTLLTSVTIPTSVTSIGDDAFGNSRLTSITIPSLITSIGVRVFEGNRLTSVTIPTSVTSIGENAFSGNVALSSITIPSSVTSIGDRAFAGNSALASVTFLGNAPTIGVDTFFGRPTGATAYVSPTATGFVLTDGFWNQLMVQRPSATYSATTLAEAAANNGSITTTITITLSNDIFTYYDDTDLAFGRVSNVPTGLTAVLRVGTDRTTATLSFTGTASSHANAHDISNLTITFISGDFTRNILPSGANRSDLVIDFADPAAASTDANLSALTLSSGTLTPTFASGTSSYSASVSNATTSVTVTPTKSDSNSSFVQYLGSTGTTAFTGTLAVGANVIRTVVTAEDGTTVKTYTITLTRAPGAANKYVVTSSSYSPTAGSPVTITAQVADVNGNPVALAGEDVTWSKSNPNGSFASATSRTNSDGIATVVFTTHNVAGTATTVTAIVGAGVFVNGTTPTITTVAGAANKYVVTSSSYSPTAGSPVTITAQVADVNGNPVALAGEDVTWSKSNPNGSFASATSRTNSDGIATVVFTTHNVAGTATTVTAIVGAGVFVNGTTPTITTVAAVVIRARPVFYQIVYKSNTEDNTSVQQDPTSNYISGTSVTVLSNEPSRTGYSFLIWNNKADGSGTSYEPGSKLQITTDITLFAQWKINQYTISFNSNGGPALTLDAMTQDYASVIKLPVASMRTGYTFIGWNTKSDGTATTYGLAENFTVGAENVVLFAQWKINQYTIRFNSNGGSALTLDAMTQDYASMIKLPVASMRTGYSFLIWNNKADGSGTSYEPGSKLQITTDITLFAQWKINQYTISFNSNGGPALTLDAMTQDYASVIKLPVASMRTGYTFIGWNTKSDGTATTYGLAENFTVGAENVVLFAQWKINQYTISYDANGNNIGRAPASTSQDFNSNVVVAAPSHIFVRRGYSFIGWSKAKDGSVKPYQIGDVFTLGASNEILYAAWKPNTYKVTFSNTTKDVLPTGIFQTGGLIASAPTPPARPRYIFMGWSSRASKTDIITFPYSPGVLKNLTLYAVWVRTK